MAIEFQLIKTENKQFVCFPEKVTQGSLNINTTFQFGVANDRSNIKCDLLLKFNQGEELVLLCEIICYFSVKPESWDEMKTDNGYSVPVFFLQHMANVVVGLTRGVIFAKSEGTVFQSHVIPLMNLTEIIKEDYKITV
jgi:hypothetical protein